MLQKSINLNHFLPRQAKSHSCYCLNRIFNNIKTQKQKQHQVSNIKDCMYRHRSSSKPSPLLEGPRANVLTLQMLRASQVPSSTTNCTNGPEEFVQMLLQRWCMACTGYRQKGRLLCLLIREVTFHVRPLVKRMN